MKQFLAFLLAFLASYSVDAQSVDKLQKKVNECFEIKDYACAEKYLTLWAGKEKNPSKKAIIYSNLGTAQRRNGLTGKALESYNTALEYNPRLTNALTNRGSLLVAMGKPAEAEADFLKALELDPGYFKAHYYLGLVYHNQKDYAQAKRSWESVLNLAGSYKDTATLLEKLVKKS